MPIKNYTTNVDVYTTIGSIQGCLVKHGAKKIMTDYDDEGRATGLSFLINTPTGQRGIRLPVNVDGVQKVLSKEKVKNNREHAEKVSWRILKDWVEAQMAILESQMVEIDEVFLPYMIDNSGNTVYQLYQNRKLMLEMQEAER